MARLTSGDSAETSRLVAVVIVTWNSADWIEAAIRSVPEDLDVLVWDNDSADDTVERISRMRRPGLRLVASIANIGFGPAVNRLAQWSTRPFLMLLNPDARLTAGALDHLAGWLAAHERDAAAVPLLLGEDGLPQYEFQLRRLPTLQSIVADLLLVNRMFPRSRSHGRHFYAGLDLTSPAQVEQPAAAAIMLRREQFLAMGGFDESFAPAWYEDVDLCRRIADAGSTITLVPSATVIHAGGSSVGTLGRGPFLHLMHRNLARYATKWFGRRAEIIRIAAMTGVATRMLLTIISPGRFTSRREGWRTFAGILRGWFHRWDDSTSFS